MFTRDSGGHTRLVCHWFVVGFAVVFAVCLCSAKTSIGVDEQFDDANQFQTYQTFLKILVANPRFGTAFDRVYEFNVNRGTIQDFCDALTEITGLTNPSSSDTRRTSEIISEFKVPPDPGVAALLAGMVDLQHANGDTAVSALRLAAQQRPDDAIAHWYLGKALVINRHFDAAPAEFEKAIACRPQKTDLLEIYKELARSLQRSNQDAKAFDVWQQLEDLFPGDLRVREQIATTLAQDGRWQDALSRYQAIAADSRNPDQRIQAYISASDLMIQLGRSEDAISLLETQLTTLDADSWLYREIRRRIEAVFRSRDDLSGLADYYRIRIKQHTDDVDAMARLGRTLSLQKQTAEAAAWYRKAIDLAPTNIGLRESLIEQLVRDNRLSDAISQYEEMATFDQGNLDHIEAWGQLYISNKELSLDERRTNAAAVWERLLTNRTEDSVTIARLASLYRRVELQDRAIALYRTAVEKSPDDPQFREYLGEYLYKLQRTDEAVAEWNEIAAGNRRSHANLIRLAEVLNRFGQTRPAAMAMREACRSNPDTAERLQFVKMLREAAERGANHDDSDRTSETSASNGTEDLRLRLQTESPRVADVDYADLTEALEQLDLAEHSAETSDERRLISGERIKTLIAAGKLEEQMNLLATELDAGTNASAERWRTLALYQDAADKLSDAIVSARKVVELEPESVSGWTTLADFCERTGQLGDAVEAMRKLATLDRRGKSEYLRKTARLQIRLGQRDDSLATGREVIKGSPGNPEAYQFFADLAFEVGEPEAAVEALRQSVRVNPADEASLRALAKTLADEFQTPEAIELYWRAFDKAQDLENQTNIIMALSNLYLRRDQFPKLIERLELRSRELNLPTEMTRCIATAYREAGEFRKSRETLERLMTDESQNVGLLKEICALAEQEHNTSQMEHYQRQITELTGADDERRRLIEILSKNGRYEEAGKERTRLAESRVDRVDILQEIEILVTGGYDDVAETLCQRLLGSSPDDWEALSAYRGILLRRLRLVEARELSRRIIRLSVDFDVPSAVDSTKTPGPVTDTPESFAAWLADSLENPGGNFGAVFCEAAVSLLFRVGASPASEDVEAVLASSLSERDQLRLSAYLIRHVTPRTPATPELWTAVEGLLEGTADSASSAVKLYEACQRYAVDDLPADGQQMLKVHFLELLKTLIAESPVWLNRSGMPILTLLPVDGAKDDISAFIEEQLTPKTEIAELGALWSVTNTLKSPKLFVRIFRVLKQRLATAPTFAAEFRTALSTADSGFSGGEIDLKLFRDHPEDVLDFLDFWVSLGASIVHSQGSNQAGEFLTLTQILTERVGAEIGSNLSSCLEFLVTSHAEAEVAKWYRTKVESAEPTERVMLNLIRADLAHRTADRFAGIAGLIDAAVDDPVNNDLRFLIATLAAKQGLIEEAVLLLDSLKLGDATRQIAREELVLQLLFPAGRSERCLLAAKRLFGLPVNMDQQRALIPAMDKLGMSEEVAAMQSRFGRGSQDRQSSLGMLLQNSIAAGKNELAGEVAWELLKLASGGSLFSGHRPDDDRDDGGERLQAIKILGRLNRLQPLIDRYEAMLIASPNSVELLEILAEFHEAAEQWNLLAAKRDRIALLSKKASPGLKAKAAELERAGDASGACDIYLQILDDEPAAFSAEMETYFQAFERAKRQSDFLKSVISQKSEYWSNHAGLLINVVASIAHEKTHDELVQDSIAALLSNVKTRRLTIGGFLARPDSVDEDHLAAALMLEIDDEARNAWQNCFSEISLLIQGLKKDENLQQVSDCLVRQIKSGGAGVSGSELLVAYIDARLLRPEAVRLRLEKCLTESQARQDHRHLLTVNQRLKELGDDWDDIRLWLLERTEKIPTEDAALADSVLDELGGTYQKMGRIADVRTIVNVRVQRILASTGASRGNAVASIRELLQAGEKIQHSGFPIEGAQLLLNVTSHDVDQFTSDLDDDKAVAFKSRFYASQRWARQQISADKLTVWFETAVQNAAEGTGQSDLLLELSGTTDPGTQDAEQLKAIRINSAILTAIGKQSFGDEKQQTALQDAIRTLLTMNHPHATTMTVSLGFAAQLNDKTLANSIVEKLNSSQETDDSVQSAGGSAMSGIPCALRTAPGVSEILAAKILASSADTVDMSNKLIVTAVSRSERIENRLVRIAVLNDCLAAATSAKLKELAGTLEAQREIIIAEQVAAVSIGRPGSVDIRQEIRTRLLGMGAR